MSTATDFGAIFTSEVQRDIAYSREAKMTPEQKAKRMVAQAEGLLRRAAEIRATLAVDAEAAS